MPGAVLRAPMWRARYERGVERLFDRVGPGGHRSSPINGAQVALAAVAAFAGAGISLLRQPGAGPFNTIWAEDGSIFLSQAATKSTLGAITTSYAGYFHLVPRILTEIALLAPAPAVAAILAIEAALCTGLIAVLVYVASGSYLSAPLARLLAAAVVVFLPLGLGDLPNSIANIHWPGLYAVFWMLLWTPRGRAGRIVAISVVLLIGCSDILALVFVPLALIRYLRPGRARDRHSLYLLVVLLASVAAQVAGLLFGASSRSLDPNPVRVASGYVLRAVPPAIVGERWLGPDVNGQWLALAAVAWLLLAGAITVAVLRYTRPDWVLAGVALAYSVAVYALPVFLTGVATPRYAAAPAMLLVTALGALLQPGEGRLRARAPIVAMTVVLAIVWGANLRAHNSRADGPRWSDELSRARTECSAGDRSVSLPITPGGLNWNAVLPCSYVD